MVWHLMDYAVLWFNTRILVITSIVIPKIFRTQRLCSHLWINERCLDLVRAKNAVEGTELYTEISKRCRAGLYEEYLEYVKAVHLRLKKLPIGGKKWWRLSHKILQKRDVSSRVPPLLKDDANWAMEDQEKTEAFATTFLENECCQKRNILAQPLMLVSKVVVLCQFDEKWPVIV